MTQTSTTSQNTDSIRVFILSGGKGTRLKSVIKDIPKPMAPIGNLPFLDYLIRNLKRYGLNKISLLTGYQSIVIEEYFQNVEISVIKESSPLGTGGAIANALRYFTEDRYLVINGDTFSSINLNEFIRLSGKDDSIALQKMETCDRYGTVKIDKNRNILEFTEKTLGIKNSYINAGIYLLHRKTLQDNIDLNKFTSLENEVFPIIALKGVEFDENFIDIGVPEDYLAAQKLIPIWVDQTDPRET